MSLKNLLPCAVCVGVFCALLSGVLLSCSSPAKSPAQEQALTPPAGAEVISLVDSTFTASRSDTLALGRIHEGESVLGSIYYRNSTSKALFFLSSSTSCGCTTVDLPAQPIKMGECVALSFEFDSEGFPGMQFKTIRLYTTASSVPLKVVLTAEVE